VVAVSSVNDVSFIPDLLILTVKSYDTESAIIQAKKIIKDKTVVLSLQNGLDNIDILKKHLLSEQIIVGITTHGVLFFKPGFIRHTGTGTTILGEINGKKSNKKIDIVNTFNNAGISTSISNNIIKEIWIKAIINSSINPLTTFFQCKNGNLIKNPILEKLVERICNESTHIAKANGIQLGSKNMIDKTKEIIRNTSENYSSMLQDFDKGKKTEIDSINGKLLEIGRKFNIDVSFNEILVHSIKTLK
jgi:2-dehydropantoate 2-reductase